MIDRDQVSRILFRKRFIEDALSEPGAAADAKRYRELVREHAALSRLEHQAHAFFRLADDLHEHRALLADPDAAIAAYGLYDAARRETIAAAFTRCFNDAKLFQAYRQTLSTLGDERQAAI